MDSDNFYLLNHRASGSEVELKCGLDKSKKKPRIISIVLVKGNIIPLQGVRQALEYHKESHENELNEPDELA